jgi:hypothetical protein
VRWDRGLFLVILAVMHFLALPACGRKAPPFLPAQGMPFIVEHLKGEWKHGGIVLRGQVVSPQGQGKELSDITGCRIDYARYALEAPPCEGCPIAYADKREIEAEVITREEFYCRVPGIKEKGIYFFKVSLIDRNGGVGPSSNRAKVMVEE